MTGNNASSSTRINWTDELKADFEAAKETISSLQAVYIPRPTDNLLTLSDYSAEHKAVGGQLIIQRKTKGETKLLNGGFFSARLGKYQENWLPCEGEALGIGIKLVLEHFAPYIRESHNQTQHCTDSQKA